MKLNRLRLPPVFFYGLAFIAVITIFATSFLVAKMGLLTSLVCAGMAFVVMYFLVIPVVETSAAAQQRQKLARDTIFQNAEQLGQVINQIKGCQPLNECMSQGVSSFAAIQKRVQQLVEVLRLDSDELSREAAEADFALRVWLPDTLLFARTYLKNVKVGNHQVLKEYDELLPQIASQIGLYAPSATSHITSNENAENEEVLQRMKILSTMMQKQ